MKGVYSKYTISAACAESTRDAHLQKLRGLMRSSLWMHKGTIHGLITFCKDGKTRSLNLHESKIIRWMIDEVSGLTTKYAAKRLQAASRYLSALYQIGLIPENPMDTLKAECGNRSWDCITEALQSSNPKVALQKLRADVPCPGPLYPYISSYNELHQSLGKSCRDYRIILGNFDMFISSQFSILAKGIDSKHVQCWVDAMRCSAETRRRKVYVLKRFFDYLVAIGILAKNPAEVVLLECGRPSKTTFKPFIFTKSQIAAILAEARCLPKTHKFQLRAETFYTLIALIYAMGLRNREARNIRFRDIDLHRRMLFIKKTKFYKSRLVPFGPRVGKCIEEYLKVRCTLFAPMKDDDPLFIAYRRVPIGSSTLGDTFLNIVRSLGIRSNSHNIGPRLHDLRHSFAVHRLLRWYKENVDVQTKLLQLSTFMGHAEIRSTEVYLTITAELLKEANNRFYRKFGAMFNKELYDE